MNLANKLTLLRVIIVPAFVVLMLGEGIIPHSYLWAAITFAAASVTDTLDGKIARKYNMITDFGKFLDPLADKMLVSAALICFVGIGWCSAWVAIIIIAREFMVSGVRLVAAGSKRNIVIAASIWGKLKTASTMLAITAILLMYILVDFSVITVFNFPVEIIRDILLYICCLLTVISGVKYLWDYREIFKEGSR